MAKKPNNKAIKLFLFSLLIIILLLIIFRTDSAEVEGKNYIGDKEECSRIQFLCIEGKERFDDEKGCGCQDLNPIDK